MNRRWTQSLVVAALLGAAPALMQAEDKPADANNERTALFKRLDANGDGVVAADEVPEEQKRLFTRLLRQDKNEDGKLSLAEFLAGPATDAPAERRPDGPPGERRPEGPPPGDLFMRLLDSDKDGKLSADELTKAGEVLKKLDRNGDGELNREELMLAMRPEPGQRPPEGGRPEPGQMLAFLKQRDANGDGKWSKDELPDRMRENFERIDANSDGFVDEAELKQMIERFAKAGTPPEGGRPNPGEFVSRIFDEADKNKDGKLDKEEAPPKLKDTFERADKNSDGFVDHDELRALLGGARPDAGGEPRKRPEGGDRPKPEGERRDSDKPKAEGGRRDGDKPKAAESREKGDKKPE